MPKATIRAEMFKSPRRYESDGKYTPVGTVQYLHSISIEGEAAKFYTSTDLTESLNGTRAKLDTGVAVPIEADVDLYVRGGKLTGGDLLALREVKA